MSIPVDVKERTTRLTHKRLFPRFSKKKRVGSLGASRETPIHTNKKYFT